MSSSPSNIVSYFFFLFFFSVFQLLSPSLSELYGILIGLPTFGLAAYYGGGVRFLLSFSFFFISPSSFDFFRACFSCTVTSFASHRYENYCCCCFVRCCWPCYWYHGHYAWWQMEESGCVSLCHYCGKRVVCCVVAISATLKAKDKTALLSLVVIRWFMTLFILYLLFES